MTVRPAHAEDHDDLARVWLEGYRASTHDPGLPTQITEADLRMRIPSDVANRGWNLYAAEAEGGIVAILALLPNGKALDQIFIGDGWRGRGVGKTLLDFVKTEMPDGFWLRTHITNTGAQGFYAHEGLTHTHDGPPPHHPEEMFRRYAWKP